MDTLRKHQDNHADADFAHMRKVVGSAHRHLAQQPEGDARNTPWRASLMNRGHDPPG